MIIVLDSIRSVYNVGSVFRTADAAGVEKIYLCGITPAPVDRFGSSRKQMTKVSLGAEKTVAWEAVKSISAVIARLKREGYQIVCVEQDKKAIPYYKLKPLANARGKNKNKLVFIFGNEVQGIRKPILKKCDTIIEIPMRGKKESLNVSVAVGIILFS
ncbi:MAG: TrmH family RNA methyltransferase [bacterium]|nr:TrmH family RNA methyltransferase [bacterium]